ncbi:MAG: hypothetical protein HKO91_06130, partial [Desulfobacterales bacterium]|nr:hypothetical protein [Desulfobacterales bacterium]
MKEETEIKPSEESENEESNSLGQDDISSLIDEMQKEKNSPEAKNKAEKSSGEETKKDLDGIKDDKNEGIDSNDHNQDDISKLLDEVQTEAKSSETEDKKDKPEQVEDDNEGEKSTESEKPAVETKQPTDKIDENENEADSKEQAKSQEKGEKAVEEEEKLVQEDKELAKGTDKEDKKKENDEQNNYDFNSLDPDEEIGIEGEAESAADPETGPEDDSGADTQKEDIDKEDDDSKNKKNNEDKESENDDDNGQAVKLKEVKNSPKGKRFKFFIIGILSVAFVLVFLGWFTFFKKPGSDHNDSVKPFQPEQITKTENRSIEDQNVEKIKNGETKDNIFSERIIAKLDEITDLKDQLVIKEREIADLIKNYKDGISEMEDEILWVKQNNQIDSLNIAMENKKIEFGMMTIQRRLAYIEKLDPPYRWLNHGIEELLYLKRKIEIDSKVSRVISGIDMDKMIHEIDII